MPAAGTRTGSTSSSGCCWSPDTPRPGGCRSPGCGWCWTACCGPWATCSARPRAVSGRAGHPRLAVHPPPADPGLPPPAQGGPDRDAGQRGGHPQPPTAVVVEPAHRRSSHCPAPSPTATASWPATARPPRLDELTGDEFSTVGEDRGKHPWLVPAVITGVLLLIASLVAARGLLGLGHLDAPALLPAPDRLGELWASAVDADPGRSRRGAAALAGADGARLDRSWPASRSGSSPP